MARANAAYYATHDPFADFTTAPEITQVFGELLGAWAAVQWQAMGQPDPVVLVEAGPGRGTLMADALRAAALMPGFRAALQVHLIETSPRLRIIQAAAVPGAVWHDTLDSVPAGPILLLANEFLDALPIRQFVQRGDAWTERHVQDGTLVELPLGEGSSRVGTAGPESLHPTLSHEQKREPGDGLVFEVNEAALAFVMSISKRWQWPLAPLGPPCTGRVRRGFSWPGWACFNAQAASPNASLPQGPRHSSRPPSAWRSRTGWGGYSRLL